MKKNQGSDLSFEGLLEQNVYSELARQVQAQRPEVAEAVIRVFGTDSQEVREGSWRVLSLNDCALATQAVFGVMGAFGIGWGQS
jgi:hypothetical protein